MTVTKTTTPQTPTIELGSNMTATPCNDASTALYNKLIIATDYAEWYKNNTFYTLDGGDHSPLGIYNMENGTYKVRAKRGDCYSGFSNAITISRITVTTPTISSTVSNCQNVLSLTNTCEGTIKWYDSGNTLLATASTYSTPSAKTIYAKCEKSGCISGNSNSVTVSAINKNPDWSDAGEACTDGQKWKDKNACSDSYNSERCLKQYLITLTNLFPERNLPNSSCSYDYTDAYGISQSGSIRTLLDKKTITVYSITEPVSKNCSNGSLSIDLVVPDKN
jgi:hypothetical protein